MPALTLPLILTSRSRNHPPLLPHSIATPVCPFLRWVTEISNGTVREKRDSSSSAIMAGCRGEPSLETAFRGSSRAGRVAQWETVQGCGFDSKQQCQMTKAGKYSPVSNDSPPAGSSGSACTGCQRVLVQCVRLLLGDCCLPREKWSSAQLHQQAVPLLPLVADAV